MTVVSNWWAATATKTQEKPSTIRRLPAAGEEDSLRWT